MNLLATIDFKIPLIQYLAFQVSRRLGVLEHTNARLNKVLEMGSTVGGVYWISKFEQAVLLLFELKSTDSF